MEVRTYRARSLRDAMQKLRSELGPDSKVVQSREVDTGWWERISRGRRFEIRARQSQHEKVLELRRYFSEPTRQPSLTPAATKATVDTPSLDENAKTNEVSCAEPTPFADGSSADAGNLAATVRNESAAVPGPHAEGPELTLDVEHRNDASEFRQRARDHVLSENQSLRTDGSTARRTAEARVQPARTRQNVEHQNLVSQVGSGTPDLFELITELVDAEIPEQTARELVEAACALGEPVGGLPVLRERMLRYLAQNVAATGPIDLIDGQQKVIALVGPTGVGKTTTIAKLAANLRLCERRRVGLITVDTYRVAAVDQLRTYAEIMDVPMEVVTTPKEMRDALTRLADCDVVLIDTAGRSPQDAVQLQQLKSTLYEAAPEEIQLVVSCTGSAKHLQQVVNNFESIGCTSILVTKLDEVTTLGNLVPALRSSGLPFSYLTCGQNVPDDIVVADRTKLLPVLIGRQPISTLV